MNYCCECLKQFNVGERCPICQDERIAKAVAAERERCAKIAECFQGRGMADHIGTAIAKEIRGGE